MKVAHRLYLLRHAKSSWDQPGLEDHERPLTRRGQQAALDMAAYLRRHEIQPTAVLCSTAERATQTLAALELTGETSYEDGLYGADASRLMARLRLLPEAYTSVMVVGHNPGLQELALGLVREAAPLVMSELQNNLPTGTLVALSLERPWSALAKQSAALEALVPPRDL
jgi:phosphohistidine phosphatase